MRNKRNQAFHSGEVFSTEQAKEHFVNDICYAAYIAITDNTDFDKYIKSTKELTKGEAYEYAFTVGEYNGISAVQFSIGAGRRVSDMNKHLLN